LSFRVQPSGHSTYTTVDYVNNVRTVHVVKHIIKLSLNGSALAWLTPQCELEGVELGALSPSASLRSVSVA
jgi:hypothetical protein